MTVMIIKYKFSHIYKSLSLLNREIYIVFHSNIPELFDSNDVTITAKAVGVQNNYG